VEHFQNAGLAIDIAEAYGFASQTSFPVYFDKSSEYPQDSIVAIFVGPSVETGSF
jgi:hypothetical protein